MNGKVERVKPFSRALGMLSLLAALTAVVVPLIAVAVFLLGDSAGAVAQSSDIGLTIAAVGVVLAFGGYVAGRRDGSTAWPIIGGLMSICVTIGFVVARSLL